MADPTETGDSSPGAGQSSGQGQSSGALARLAAEIDRVWLTPNPHLRPLVRLLGEALIELAGRDASVPAAPNGDAAQVTADPSTAQGVVTSAAPGIQSPQNVPSPTALPPPGLPPTLRGPRAVVPLRIGNHDPVEIEVPGGGQADTILRAMEAPTRADHAHVPKNLLPDLSEVAKRCEVKAESVRLKQAEQPTEAWHLAAQKLLRKYSDLAGLDLWPLHVADFSRMEVERIDALRQAFDNLAAACRLVVYARQEVEGERLAPHASDTEREILSFLAEAQSALRVACESWERNDADQDLAFQWLKIVTREERVYLDRFMRWEDPGDPSRGSDLAQRLTAARVKIDDNRSRRTFVPQSRQKLAYHRRRLLESKGEEHDFNQVAACLEKLLSAGVRKSELRSLVAPLSESSVWSTAPAQLLALVSALAEAPEDQSHSPRRTFSPNIERVRSALEGRRIVIVGGEERVEHIERYREAFGVAEVDWVSLTEHASSEPLRSKIRPDVALVLLLIKLAGHQHIDDARAWARQADVPTVNIIAGYSPESAAMAIIEQASEKLGL